MAACGGTRCRRVLLLLLLLPLPLQAGPLFDADDVLEVRISGPFYSLIRNKEHRKESRFVLSFDGTEYDFYIRVRGKSRVRVCQFPPLRLDFKTRDLAGTVFAGQDKLKLVTHCRNYDRGEADMLQEYVAYRIFNAITDNSYRVRLLRIHYDDTDKRLTKKAAHRYGFLLEPAAEFAGRVGAERLRVKTVVRGKLDDNYAALMFVFQYLVANTDWSMVNAEGVDECCHNVDLYAGNTGSLLVPYDLDLSGVVNARYAFPDKSLRISRVTQRLYGGLCMERDVLRSALRHVKSLRAEILAIPGSVPGLSSKDARVTREFLEKFFVDAENEEDLLDTFGDRCIKPRYRSVE